MVVACAAALVAAIIVMGAMRRRQDGLRETRRHAAIPEFDARRAELAAEFLMAAAATGKPRGLRWKAVELGRPVLFAVDRATGDLVALAPASISFEAVAGGGMEDVEAVGNLRSATAVFTHRDGRWTTAGRVVFNLEPGEALARFGPTLEDFET